MSGAPLSGIIPALATPLRGPDALDGEGLERLVDRVLAAGVHGLFLLGTCGEGPSLSQALRRELVERVVHLARGRVPVLVNITDSSPAESLLLARFAADRGATHVVASAPFYFAPGPDELAEFTSRLADASPLPVLLYNYPAMTRVPFGEEALQRALDHPKVAGVKDSSGDLGNFARLCLLRRGRSDWAVLMGCDGLLGEGLRLGGTGGVCGGANVSPRPFSGLYDSFRRGDAEAVRRAEEQVRELGLMLYGGGRAEDVVRGLKAALEALGVCRGDLAPPLLPLSEVAKAPIREWVLRLSPSPPPAPAGA